MNQYIKYLVPLLVAAGGVAITAAFKPIVMSKSPATISPARWKQIQEGEIQRQTEEDDLMRPVADMVVRGDYQGALQRCRELDQEGWGPFTTHEIECLVRLGRATEGLHILQEASDRQVPAMERASFGVYASLAAHDEQALHDALTLEVRLDRTSPHGFTPDGKLVFNLPVTDSEIDAPRLLMEVACEFGRSYDRDALRFIGDEAIRRGATDYQSLSRYAEACTSNGDLRFALQLFQRALPLAGDDQARKSAAEDVRAAEFRIDYYSKIGPIDEQERWLQAKHRDQLYRQKWH